MDMADSQGRRLAVSAGFPDLMNDPAYDPRDKGMEDQDTCRICHGEATEEEPLFYPCKCSGSIKFVHQLCLVEWLSHSQKKHCELCKTPFRFTKLYDPNMPQSLPAPLFLRQAFIQSFRTLVTWLRFLLVAFVWLAWLPWSMRAIWRALFWLADGRWSGTETGQRQVMRTFQDGATQLITYAVNEILTDSAGSTYTTKYAGTSTITHAASSAASAVPQAQSSMPSVTAGEPFMLTIIKKIIPALLIPGFTSTGGQGDSSSGNATTNLVKPRHPSWLSDVKFLNSLTPYPTINNMIIDTLEGQLITLLVVVAFILLFLIREWVVQQQPMANIADGEREAAVNLIANNRPEDEQDAEGIPRPLFGQHAENHVNQEHGVHGHDPDDDARAHSPAPSWSDAESDSNASSAAHSEGDPFGARVPDSRPGSHTGRVSHVREIYARANGNRDEMFRILQEEGLEDELGWLVDALTPTPLTQASPLAGQPSFQAAESSTRAPENVDNEHAEPSGPSNSDNTGPTQPTDAHDDQQPVTNNEAAAANTSATENRETDTPHHPQGAVERLFDWFWGDITPVNHDALEPVPEDDEQIVQDPALEDPFVPLQPRAEDAQADGDIAAAGDAGMDANDMDAIEGDDFEGIMDLIGMQGPIFGLLQNGVFCALLIAFTVALGIWLPYLWGKIALVLLANPVELVIGVPMTAITVVADIALDTLIGSLGYLMYGLSFALSPFGAVIPIGKWIPRGKSITSASLSLIDASSNRLHNVVKSFLMFHQTDIPMFSILSHQALRLHQARMSAVFQSGLTFIKFIVHDLPLRLATLGFSGSFSFNSNMSQSKEVIGLAWQQLSNLTKSSISRTSFMNGDVAKTAAATIPVDYDLAVWDTKDRIIAILMGYLLASIMGLLYLRITGFLSGASRGQRIEGIFAEILLQAGGVMKVILIIGIEMIVFPLYCGTLLDVALLPLFSSATIASRIAFTARSPLTSLFVHWFIGTCYMFHFALFVSMCRKILRSGVLYFIRDPDDPTFHPIRDVLERSITTQLRKIGFSALVYGALVIVFLGGVVWGLHFAVDGVLPLNWSSSAPMLEFPVDLLFYNFVLPLAVRSLKPSDGLHDLYDWWFHKCAHFLRLSNFFFPERHLEEEGHHVRRSWWGVLVGRKGDWENPVIGEDQRAVAEQENRDAYFVRDGRYVRAPASDQVRIPKGTRVFVEVTEENERVDGKPDPDDGLHGRSSNSFTRVYIPPFFRTRVAAFILLIWLFAATTGVGITIIPLVIGRKIISSCVSNPVPVNDVYAFSCGLCVAGGVAYIAFHCRTILGLLREQAATLLHNPRQVGQALAAVTADAARLLYIAAVFVVLLPSLFALLSELYLLIPMHTFFDGGHSHVVHLVQDWTLGVLYVQMAIKLTLWHPHSWAAAILNGIFHDCWFRPNVTLATRALVLPVILFTVVATALPLSVGFCVRWAMFTSRPELPSDIYRYAYPATLLLGLALWTVHLVRRQVALWRIDIRDDVYLIGERLHNFSEKRARDVGVSRRVITE
ncbi:Zinc finger RING-CH-type [Penicillium lagena]|uniref:Zinc finger RING-CH-type n=1 Tax=Penicillium lagena TaxID=94218 RepID=UPI002541A16E|nr:Zinc finger RING-CH-type [Penicillium lagena]KAJ5605589.1 Zinc finger RING-CH-type [Penicillium lagena]